MRYPFKSVSVDWWKLGVDVEVSRVAHTFTLHIDEYFGSYSSEVTYQAYPQGKLVIEKDSLKSKPNRRADDSYCVKSSKSPSNRLHPYLYSPVYLKEIKTATQSIFALYLLAVPIHR